MTNPFILTEAQARKIILHAAGLAQQPSTKGPEAVYELIDHLGFVQIDTNYVVERAHHHIIASRIPGYQTEWLGELQADGRIYEFFSAGSGYMPMHDFRYSLPVKQSFLSKRKPLTQQETNLMNRILDRIGREGPLMVKDFENDRTESSLGWWDWRPSKIALERLYFEGSLMTTRTKEFHKVYDLPGNLVPDDIDTAMPTPEEFARHVIRRDLKCMGIAYAKELAWRARYVKGNLVKKELEKLADEGEICRVAIDGRKTAPVYMLPAYKNKKIKLSDKAFILSPFDIVNIFRHRLKDFFNFDYQIECFVPEAKRQFGYFSLPVLVGDTFVARMDAKADRKQRRLVVNNLHFEPQKQDDIVLAKIAGAIKSFAQFNRCPDIQILKSNSKQYTKSILAQL